MTQSNLTLTEKAIKNHSKRLQTELKTFNQNLSLYESQNLYAKILGFNNFNELKNILNNNIYSEMTINEKFIFVYFSLILDDDKYLASEILKNLYFEGFHEILTQLLFDNYSRSSYINEIIDEKKSKEKIFIKLITEARKIFNIPSAFFIFLKKDDIELWNTINRCQRI